MYLPTKNDWLNWAKIEEKVIMLMSDQPIINILPILIVLDNWLNYSRPPTRLEIQTALYEKNLEGINWWQSIIPSQPLAETSGKIKMNERPNSSEHRIYKVLEDRGLISSKSFKEMKNISMHVHVDPHFHAADTIRSMKHGRERYYSITPLGKIYLNVILQKPWLSISLNREYVVRGFLSISTLSWMYLEKPRIYPKDFIKKVNRELTENLSVSFWNLDSPVKRIVSEYKTLLAYKQPYEGKLRKIKNNEKFFSLLNEIEVRNNRPPMELFFPEKIISEEVCTLSDSFLTIIENKARKIGLGIDNLNEQIKLLV